MLNHIEICRMAFFPGKICNAYVTFALSLFLLFVSLCHNKSNLNCEHWRKHSHNTSHITSANVEHGSTKRKNLLFICVCVCVFVLFCCIFLIYIFIEIWMERMKAFQWKQFAEQAVAYVGLIRILHSMFTYTLHMSNQCESRLKVQRICNIFARQR